MHSYVAMMDERYRMRETSITRVNLLSINTSEGEKYAFKPLPLGLSTNFGKFVLKI
jgi:hypothetical protein